MRMLDIPPYRHVWATELIAACWRSLIPLIFSKCSELAWRPSSSSALPSWLPPSTFSMMLPKSIYIPLANKAPLELATELDQGYTYPRPQKNHARLHWLAHGVSVGLILILLLVLKHHDHASWAYCWNLRNYYCKSSLALRHGHG